MSLTKEQFLDLLTSGDYHVLQKKDDCNREDIVIRREDGRACEIENYPYRKNQLPAYIFDEFIRSGILSEDVKDELAGTIFRATQKAFKAGRAA